MTVIAWDGKCLAVDKQATAGEMPFKATKLRRIDQYTVAAFCGDLEFGLILTDWFVNGATKEDWPAFQRTDKWAKLVVVKAGKCMYYDQEPYPQAVEEDFMAFGSGRDLAMGVLEMGADAVKAVEIASKFNIYCGMGVDFEYCRKP